MNMTTSAGCYVCVYIVLFREWISWFLQSLPELGMQLGGLGTEVLPHRIGALATQTQSDELLMTNIY